MNKSELIDKIAGAGLKKADAAVALDAVLKAFEEALKAGDKIALVGFGTFDVGYRAARKGINPSNQTEIKIADKVTVRFKAGKSLAEAVDNKELKEKFKKEAKDKKAASEKKTKAADAPKAEEKPAKKPTAKKK